MHTNFDPFLYSVEAYFILLRHCRPVYGYIYAFVSVHPPHWPKYSSLKDDKTPCINIFHLFRPVVDEYGHPCVYS